MNQVNDLGYGVCPECKKWKILSCFHPLDVKKPRKTRRRVCPSCQQTIKGNTEPFYLIKRAISNHKAACKEGDYQLHDLTRLIISQGGKCAYCKSPIYRDEFTIEHIVPRKYGGRNLLHNILCICPACNYSKQHYELTHWLGKKKYTLLPRVFMKVRASYESHDYEFKASCTTCHAHGKSLAICTACTTQAQAPA